MQTDEVLDLIKRVAAEVVEPRWRHLAAEQITEKVPGDLVTVADREAEQVLTAELSGRVPGCIVVGEEAAFSNPRIVDALPTAEIAYVVDPVDGTRNFVKGSPDYAVMVSETRRGVTTRSWIWQPALGAAFVAERGAGLWRNGVRVPTPDPHDGPPTGRSSKRRLWGWDADGRLAPVAEGAWCVGVDYPSLCLGEVDYLVYKNLKPWDHLPGALMVREIGGTVSLFDGTDYDASVTGSGLVVAVTSAVAGIVIDTWGQVEPIMGHSR